MLGPGRLGNSDYITKEVICVYLWFLQLHVGKTNLKGTNDNEKTKAEK